MQYIGSPFVRKVYLNLTSSKKDFTLPAVVMNILAPIITVKASSRLPQASANSGPITTAGSGRVRLLVHGIHVHVQPGL